jgi:PAS domain S-box-containing protein
MAGLAAAGERPSAAFALDGFGVGVWAWDIAAGTICWSPELRVMYGFAADDDSAVTIEVFTNLLHEDDRARVMATVSRTLDQRLAQHEVRFRIRRADGVILHILSRANLECDENGVPRRLHGMDINLASGQSELHITPPEQQVLLQSAIDAADLGTWTYDFRTQSSVSRSLRHDMMFGYAEPQQDWTLEIAERHLSDEDRIILRHAMAQARKTGRLDVEFQVKWNDGSTHWVHATGKTEYDSDGTPARMLGVVADITERKQTELRLRNTAAQLQAGLAVAGLGLGEIDYQAGTIALDARAAELYGLTSGAPLPRSAVHQIFHPDDAPELQRAITSLLQREQDSSMAVEHRIVLPNQDVRWLNVRKQIFTAPDSQGIRRPIHGVLAAQDITERKKADASLREATQFMEGIFAAAPVSIYIHSALTGKNEFISARGRQMLGYDEESWPRIIADVAHLMHPDDAARLPAHFARLANAVPSTPLELEYRMRHADGSWRWFRSRDIVHERDAQGNPLKVLGAATDITNRKHDEEALRRATETFQQLVERSPFGVYVVDSDFRLALVSDGAQKAFENVRPLIGRDFSEVMHILWPEAFASQAIAIFRRTLETGEPYHAPSMVEQRSDVEDVESYDWKTERITMPDGRFGVVCHFYDLSERQRYEEAISASERRFRNAFESSAVSLWEEDFTGVKAMIDELKAQGVDDMRGHLTSNPEIVKKAAGLMRVIRVNKRSVELFEAENEDELKRSLADVFTDETYAAIHNELVAIADGTHSIRDETRMRTLKGKPLDVMFAIKFPQEPEGWESIVVSLTDITDRKKDEEHRELLLRELNHRVKNTLAVVQGMASQTLRDGEDVAVARGNFSARLLSLAGAHDILIQQDWQAAPLRDVVQTAIQPYHGRGNDRFRLDGPDIDVDPAFALSLAMVLHELSTNAVKYGALSRESGAIDVAWQTEDGRLELRWQEKGGPRVAPPTRRGFGSRLIERAFSGNTNCEVKMDYADEGVICIIAAKL